MIPRHAPAVTHSAANRTLALRQIEDAAVTAEAQQVPLHHSTERTMATNPLDQLPSAKDLMQKIAQIEGEKAAEYMRRRTEGDAEKQSLIDQLRQPSGVSDEEAIRRATVVIQRAVNNGLTEVQVYRFPNDLCSDRGRAINQMEPGWESTLTGVPKEIYELWRKYFRDRGYKLRVQILEFPGGMPGDVGMSLSWG
jgi:hypothetical protein